MCHTFHFPFIKPYRLPTVSIKERNTMNTDEHISLEYDIELLGSISQGDTAGSCHRPLYRFFLRTSTPVSTIAATVYISISSE